MIKNRNYLPLAFVICLITSFSAFAEQGCIAVVPATSHTQYWKTVGQGAKDAGKAHNVPIYVRGPVLEDDVLAQKKIIEISKRKGCVGFVIAPLFASLNEEVANLIKYNIPSIYIDRGTDGNDLAKSIISTDNYKAGHLAGEEMVRLLNGSGKVAVMRLHKSILSTNLREKGFIDSVERAGIKVVLDKYLGVSYGSALREAHKYRDQLYQADGIFSSNESVTQGIYSVLSDQIQSPYPVHIGFDLNNKIAEGIEKAFIQGVIIQDPYQMGYRGVEVVLDVLARKKVKRAIRMPVHFVTKDNLSEHAPK